MVPDKLTSDSKMRQKCPKKNTFSGLKCALILLQCRTSQVTGHRSQVLSTYSQLTLICVRLMNRIKESFGTSLNIKGNGERVASVITAHPSIKQFD